MREKSIAVVGAGSWGTALAMVLANNNFDVDLFTRNEIHKNEINIERTNKKYLDNIIIPQKITASTSLEEVVANKKYIVLVVPSHGMRETVRKMRPYIQKDTLIVHATKGIETESLKRMGEVITEELPDIPEENIMALSGPSHAEEVSRKMPTTVVIAGKSIKNAEKFQDIFINSDFRVYTNSDMVGVEIAGSLKNIIAIGAGLSDGLEFGDNAKAALITRGLVEIARLGVEMGANPLTFSGLAGVGDLIVTSTSKHSRNWRAGYMIGKGKSLETVLSEMGMVVEGVKTTKAAFYLAESLHVEMPITTQLYKVLFENKRPALAVEDLMGRVKTHEMEELSLQVFRENR